MGFKIDTVQVDNGYEFVNDTVIQQVSKHERCYNKTAKTSLNFKSPNQVVKEYLSKCNICLDN